ncbi:MAG: DEAD/DEAH box helicase, partial [Treponema sp.]|nr:DEAD/DEAH box helicase [Treponema sp.]
LAVQIEEEAKMLSKHLPFKTGSFYGGVGYAQQEKLLRDNVQIMVGTPGRVLDLNKTGRMNLMDISFLVLDEADRMFDMGFYPDLRKLIRVVPAVDRRQTMLFSATLNAWVKNLAWEYTKSPIEIDIEPEVVTVEEISQVLYHVPSEEKMPMLLGILKREQPQSAIIFCNTKKHTEIVAKRLRMNGYPCEFIIGDLPQVKRLKVIDDVKAGKIKMLVATDVAARGLDIESLAMVINYDVPTEAENYVHRIGRTARAGKSGRAITLASEQDVYELPAIERYIGKKVPSEIAGQDLYAEDKSAHQYIRTDVYEERARRDSAKNHANSNQRFGHERRGKENQRITRKNESKNKKNQDVKSRYEHHDNNRKEKPQIHASSKNHEQDLSHLSMEERMAMYKKKYGHAAGGSTEHKKHSKQHQHHEHKSAAAVEKQKPPSAPAPSAAKFPAQSATKFPALETEKPAEKAVKKGFFAKILGLFKK